VKVWFDREADYLEVRFKEAPGYMKETAHDGVMERVDSQGKVIGFSIPRRESLHEGKAFGGGIDGV